MKPSDLRYATAAAPASVGNVAVGFDLLGHALAEPADRVTVRRNTEPGVRIDSIGGLDVPLPRDPQSNTASRAVAAMLEEAGNPCGLAIDIDKGIPLASGLGGSAASAVAAVVAADAVLGLEYGPERLYPFALAGEAVASGAAHGDNVGPQLLGGLVLATADRLIPVPVPEGLVAVAVHPNHRIATRDARQCLSEPFPLQTVVAQSANLAQVLAGCFRGDPDLIRAGLHDVMIEPRRAALVPGFDRVQRAAVRCGALGASISGAGPTMFGWFMDGDAAAEAADDMVAAFAEAGLAARAVVSPVAAAGAAVIESG